MPHLIRPALFAAALTAATALTAPAASAQPATIVCGQSGSLTCTLTQPRCHPTGGKFGGGYETFTATLTEYGRSGVTRMRQRAQAQALIGGSWRDETPIAVRYSTRFSDTAADHTFTYHWRADFPASATGRDRRVVWQGVWLPLDRRTPVYELLCHASAATQAAAAVGSLTWHVGATTSADGCLIRITVTTVGRGFTGAATAREGEIVAQTRPFNIPPSGGTERRSVTVPPGGTYTVQLVTRNGFVKRQTQVSC